MFAKVAHAPRPPTLVFDGLKPEAAYRKAREEFARILLAQPIIDVMGRRVLFTYGYRGGPETAPCCQPLDRPDFDTEGRTKDDCWHLCFKDAQGGRDPYGRRPRDTWRADRAARIPWIIAALTAPETRIRPSAVRPGDGRQAYAVIVPADSQAGLAQEFFGAFVRTGSNPACVFFITAYTLDGDTFNKIKKGGPLIYPADPVKKPKK